MSDPYRSAKPGDAILAETWNQMQRDVREHILTHTHTGGPSAGTILTGASIDKASTIEVQKVIATSSLSVSNIDVKSKLDALTADKLSITGGIISGPLSVTGATTIGNTLNLTAAPSKTSPVISTRTIPVGQGQANERTELIMFHGSQGGSGPDAITLRAPEVRLQTYDNAAVTTIDNNAGSNDRLVISPDGSTSIRGSLSVAGAMTGPPNDYIKAQFTMSGGGTVTWANNRLKWTNRFIAISAERPNSFSGGHVNIYMPTANLLAANVYDGKVRSVDTNGISLSDWEALYAVHRIGGDQSAVEYRIVNYSQNHTVPSNWILVAVRSNDDNSIKLGTGEIINAGGTLVRSKLSATTTGVSVTGALSVSDTLNMSSGKSIQFADNGEIASFDDKHRLLFRRTEDILELREYGSIMLSAGATSGTATDTVRVTKGGTRINGTLNVVGAEGYAIPKGYMAKGSLTIGDIQADYGGGSNWTSNTAGLLLECKDNTEIAIHDSGHRVASLMHYEGGNNNRVTIGRNMGWGALGSLNVACDLNVSGSLKVGSNYAATAPDHGIRIIWGFINSAANIVAGKGFTVGTESSGFRITFTTPFAARPCIVATQHWDGNIRDNAVVYDIQTTSCLIKTGDQDGKASLRHFCFIAIGA